MAQTDFQKALDSAMKSVLAGAKIGAFRTAMAPLGQDFKITAIDDAQALIEVIVAEAAKHPPLKSLSPFTQLIDLLRRCGNQEVFERFQERALPSLEELFDWCMADAAGSTDRDLSKLLVQFVFFAREQGFLRMVRAIECDLPLGWMWTVTFRGMRGKHPLVDQFLSLPLEIFPRGFVPESSPVC